MTRSAGQKKEQSVPMKSTTDLEWARRTVQALLVRLLAQAMAARRAK
jgi:hypothetical protein